MLQARKLVDNVCKYNIPEDEEIIVIEYIEYIHGS
jgi:hypothetical protein